MKIAHIVNPVNVTENSDLFIAQPITFETMRRAKKYAKDNKLDVDLFYTCFEEDLCIAPEAFNQTELLNKSILDYKEFEKKRKLPLIKDILDRLYESSDADYFIYTNVDIAVMPHFYTEIESIVNSGYDAFVINRRTIDKKYTSIDEIPQMYSDIGNKHPGYDCFVFKREVYPKYLLETACIGANWIGRVLISNLILNSTNNFKLFTEKHLTFHIGDDRSWKISTYNPYDDNNEQSLLKVFEKSSIELKNVDNFILRDIINYHLKDNKKESEIDWDLSNFTNKNNTFYNIFSKSNTPISQEPTFIVGFPRSGTTFLLDNLVSQNNIYSLPETHFFDIVSQNLTLNNYEMICRKIEKWTPLSEDAKEFIKYFVNKKQLNKKLLFEIIIINYLIKQVGVEELANCRWIEKTPDHSLYLSEIESFYPNAKFIYILRNPISTFNSWRRVASQWGGSSKIASEYSKMWKYRLESAMEFKLKNPNKLMFVKLENLRSTMYEELSKIMKYINSKFDKLLVGKNNEKSKFLFLENEVWKKDSVSKEVKKDDIKAETDLTDFEKIEVIYSLKNYLKKFGYLNVIAKNIIITKEEIKDFILTKEDKEYELSISENEFVNINKKLKKLTEIKFSKNPLQKYKSYKELIFEYSKMKG